MDSNEIKITCPECGCEIDVDGILAHRIEERIKKDYSNKFAEKLKENEEQKLKLEQEKNELNKREIELQKTLEDAVSQKLKSQEPILKESLKKDIEQEQSQQFQSLQNQHIAQLYTTTVYGHPE